MIIEEGTATFTDDTTPTPVGVGSIAVVPAGEPHAFKNTGNGRLRQIDIHVADAFATEWLGEAPSAGTARPLPSILADPGRVPVSRAMPLTRSMRRSARLDAG